jgi:hypothetical protein
MRYGGTLETRPLTSPSRDARSVRVASTARREPENRGVDRFACEGSVLVANAMACFASFWTCNVDLASSRM